MSCGFCRPCLRLLLSYACLEIVKKLRSDLHAQAKMHTKQIKSVTARLFIHIYISIYIDMYTRYHTLLLQALVQIAKLLERCWYSRPFDMKQCRTRECVRNTNALGSALRFQANGSYVNGLKSSMRAASQVTFPTDVNTHPHPPPTFNL